MSKRNRHNASLKTKRVTNVKRYRTRSVLRSAVSMSPVTIVDRRAFHPAGDILRPLFSPLHPNVNRTVIQNPSYVQPSYSKGVVTFDRPDLVPVCVRRKARKQVLHAKGVAGRKNLRPPRRNSTSDISCR